MAVRQNTTQRRFLALMIVCLSVVALAASAAPAAAALTDPASFPAGYEGYHTYAEAVTAMQAAADAHPDIARMYNLGRTFEGRTIWALKISDNVAADEGEPEILTECNMHAREHITTEQCLFLIQLLTDNYGRTTNLGDRVTNIVNGRVIWIIPMLNPDGSMADIAGGAWHNIRKNRQTFSYSSAIGIDLNRNWSYMWGCCGGSSGRPSSARYRGDAPFQATEDQVLRNFIFSRRSNGTQRITEILNIHSYGEHVLYPYGYTHAAIPPDMSADDHATFVAMADAMASLNGYRAMQGSQQYIYDGDFIDWAYGNQHIFAFTWEMYPGYGCGCGGFHPPASVIARETQRNQNAALYLFEQADCPYRAAGLASQYCS